MEAFDEGGRVRWGWHRAGVDHVDAEFGEPFELPEVSVEILERVLKEANGFPDLGDVTTHRFAMSGQHIYLVGYVIYLRSAVVTVNSAQGVNEPRLLLN